MAWEGVEFLGGCRAFSGKSAVAERDASGLRWLLKSPPRRAASTVGTLACLPVQSLPRAAQDYK
jgi:hypothetical protein